MSKRYRWIYPALRPLDIGLCHARTPLGAGIRLFSGGGPYNHTWIATSDHGQIAATEMGGGGCRLRSLEHYRGPVDTVPLVIRWEGWRDVEAVEQWLAQLRRRRAEPRNYGWAAILQPWTWLTSGGPRDTDGTRGIYCSELVARALLMGGIAGTPAGWVTRWPSPNDLALHLLTRPDCRDVTREVQVQGHP